MEKVELKPEIQPVIASDHVVKITSSRSMMEPSTPLTNEGSSIKMIHESIHESSSSKLTPSKPIKSSIGKDSATSRMAYDDRRSRDEEFSVKRSVQEMRESDSDYNPRTLPNTKLEAVRWLGVSDLPYEAYLSTPGGRLCQHELVANLVDISSVYNSTQTLMMMFYPYVVDITYHRIAC